MLKAKLIHCLPFFILLPFSGAYSQTPVIQAASDSIVSLPAIRRVAIDIPRHNISQFREEMRTQASQLAGIAASTLNVDDMEEELARKLRSAMARSGRFWALSIDTRTEKKSEKNNFQKEYDLDAFLESTVTLEGDHTRLKVVLKDARQDNRILAREDVYFNSQPSFEALEKAADVALSRLITTLGHDGKITFERSDLVTVDFGKERGLAPGHTIEAGYVLLSSQHPTTGEFLRSKRVVTHKLEVIEARQGSAICKKIAIDESKVRQYAGKAGADFLAWKQDNKLNSIDTPKKTFKLDLEGSASQVGRGYFPAKEMNSLAQNHTDSMSESTVTNTQTESNLLEDQKTSSTVSVIQNNASVPKALNLGSKWDNPSSWHFYQLSPGAAATFATHTLDGTKSSEVPVYLFSKITLAGKIQVDSEIGIRPFVSASSFAGEVEAAHIYTRVPVLWELGKMKDLGVSYHGGMGFIAAFGEAKSILGTSDLMYIQPTIDFGFSQRAEELGTMKLDLGVSVVELFSGKVNGYVDLVVEPSQLLPKELEIYLRWTSGPSSWSEMSIGAQWNLY